MLIMFLCISPNIYAQRVKIGVLREKVKENSIYADIMNRSKESRNYDSRSTTAHETIHGIHADYRNRKMAESRYRERWNALYTNPDTIFLVQEPNIKITEYREVVPKSLRGEKYKLYLQEQTQYWNDVPFYILDEYFAYMNDAEVAIQDKQNGKKTDQADVAFGALELGICGICAIMEIEKRYPGYMENNKDFINYFRESLLRTKASVDYATVNFPFKQRDEFLNNLRTKTDAEQLRKFIVKHFDGIFL